MLLDLGAFHSFHWIGELIKREVVMQIVHIETLELRIIRMVVRFVLQLLLVASIIVLSWTEFQAS